VTLPSTYHLQFSKFNKANAGEDDLKYLEEVHNVLEVYNWLWAKFEVEFVEIELCKVLKERVCEIIDDILLHSKIDFEKMVREREEATVEKEEEGEETIANV